MGREIKFRAWDNVKKRWLNDHDTVYISDEGYCSTLKSTNYNGDYLSKEDAVIEVWTGLKDKNDNEIYEGDIIEFVGGTANFLPCGIYASHRHPIGTLLVVQYMLSGFELKLPIHLDMDYPNIVGNVHQYDFWNHARSLNVIGNIHEHPELLESEKEQAK